MPVPSQNLIRADSVVVSASDRLASQRCRENERALPVVARRLRTRTALVLEIIALRHQIAVLEHDRTRRPCLRPLDRLLWILLSHWWSGWRESLMIVQPETVLRWRPHGWSALWGMAAIGIVLAGGALLHNSK